jgi:hypothetical protein
MRGAGVSIALIVFTLSRDGFFLTGAKTEKTGGELLAPPVSL